jgi:hypothetical protein
MPTRLDALETARLRESLLRKSQEPNCTIKNKEKRKKRRCSSRQYDKSNIISDVQGFNGYWFTLSEPHLSGHSTDCVHVCMKLQHFIQSGIGKLLPYTSEHHFT